MSKDFEVITRYKVRQGVQAICSVVPALNEHQHIIMQALDSFLTPYLNGDRIPVSAPTPTPEAKCKPGDKPKPKPKPKSPKKEVSEIPLLKDLPRFHAQASLVEKWDQLLTTWKETYTLLDIEEELKKAHAWCDANPDVAPKARFSRFINSWLTRGHDRKRKEERRLQVTPTPRPDEKVDTSWQDAALETATGKTPESSVPNNNDSESF